MLTLSSPSATLLSRGARAATALDSQSLPMAPWPDQGAPAPGGGGHVWPLRPAWSSILPAVLALGPVAAQAGDGLCRLAQRGPLRWGSAQALSTTSGPAPLLQADAGVWVSGIATQSRLADGRVRRGMAFYDAQGLCVLGLTLGAGASIDGFHHLVRRYAALPGVDLARVDGLPGDAAPPAGAAAQPRWPGLLAADRPAQALARLAGQGLAEPLACDALLEVLRHVAQAGLSVRVRFFSRGARFDWAGGLHHLACRDGQASARGLGIHLQWCEDQAGPQAWLLREATAFGLRQSVLLLGPEGELRLGLSAPDDGLRPEPCAWRSAIDAARGGRPGNAC